MGLRDRFQKKGGGFLNNVTGIITGFAFTTEPGWDNANGRLYGRLDIRQDGAEEVTTTHLDAGLVGDMTISEDGHSVEETDAASLWNGTPLTRFYNSLVDNAGDSGFEDVDDLNFGHIVGVRATFVQVKDEEKMARDAKNYKRSKGAINESGQRKGKDSKFYDQRTLEASTVISIGNEVETAAPKKGAVKTAGKPAAKVAKPKADDGAELKEFGKNVVISLLEGAKDGKLVRTSLSTGIIKYFNQPELKNSDKFALREPVRQLVADEAFIAEMVADELITFEKNTLALAG